MGVRVQPGTLRIPTGTAPANYYYEGAIDTASPGEAVTIATANPANPRIDYIVAYIDKGVTRSTATTNNANLVLKLAAVAGTAASSPVVPTGTQITTAIGASNPYIILAKVAVGTGVTQISNADITDLRQRMVATPPKTVDANGWTVYDYGTWKQWRKRITNSSTYAAGQSYDLTLSSDNLPFGMTSLGANFIAMSWHVNTSAWAFHAGLEMTTASTQILIDGRNNGGTTLAFDAVFDITITTP